MALLEKEEAVPFLIRFRYKIEVTNPITLTNYSGHLTNEITKKMLALDDPIPQLIQVSPLATRDMKRYVMESPYTLAPDIYEFTVTTIFDDVPTLTRLVQHSHVELEGVKCKVMGVEFQPISLENLRLRGVRCPECFYLVFRTPTRIRRRSMRSIAGRAMYELLPTPTYVFGELAAAWNKIIHREEMKINIQEYLEWVRSHMVVTPHYRLRTHTVRLGGREFHGFVGKIGYSSTKPRENQHAVTVILARVSQYIGVGMGRRLGMGITKYLEG